MVRLLKDPQAVQLELEHAQADRAERNAKIDAELEQIDRAVDKETGKLARLIEDLSELDKGSTVAEVTRGVMQKVEQGIAGLHERRARLETEREPVGISDEQIAYVQALAADLDALEQADFALRRGLVDDLNVRVRLELEPDGVTVKPTLALHWYNRADQVRIVNSRSKACGCRTPRCPYRFGV